MVGLADLAERDFLPSHIKENLLGVLLFVRGHDVKYTVKPSAEECQ